MLVTHATLVKIICFVLPVLFIYNFFYFSLLSIPRQDSIAQVLQDWTSLNRTPPSAHFHEDLQQSRPPYAESPPVLNQLFSSPNPDRKDFHEWNAKTLRDLHACMALNNCGPNQMKVALLADYWIEEAAVRGFRGGEGVW